MMAKTRSASSSSSAFAGGDGSGSRTLMKPALTSSSSSIMSSSCFLVVMSWFVLFSVFGGVGLSDGASVPITLTPSSSSSSSTTSSDADILESLVSSRILMDHTSSSSSSSSNLNADYSAAIAAASTVLDVTASSKAENRIEDDGKSGSGVTDEEEVTTTTKYSSITTGSTTLPTPPKKLSSSSIGIGERDGYASMKKSTMMSSSTSSSTSPSSSSPLHVARCRATCLEKFNTDKSTTTSTSSSTTQQNEEKTTTSADELLLLPILRSRRRKRSSSSIELNLLTKRKPLPSWSCFQDSPDCLTCWKSCELLEPKDLSSASLKHQAVTKLEEESKQKNVEGTGGDENKQSILLACSSKQHCMGGCQVACYFYQRLFSSWAKSGDKNEDTSDSAAVTTADPVVAMKHESVVKIAPGKITWPRSISQDSTSSVVYIVIQEYPDRKWRQIAQTTETGIEIPMELTSTMSTKLRSVRVLVVGKAGLLAVYNPEKNVPEAVVVSQDNSANNSTAKVNQPSPVVESSGGSGNDVSQKTTVEQHGLESMESGVTSSTRNNALVSDSPSSLSMDVAANEHLVYANTPVTSSNTPTPTTTTTTTTSHDDTASVRSNLSNDNITPMTQQSSESLFTSPEAVVVSVSSDPMSSPSSVVAGDPDKAIEPFELRVVSLIHQKSLVIAELKWNEIGGNPNQDYLITWELTGGGLKGHLVTDSTSVTLSLWPDTTYQIQVEQFIQDLDSDGEVEVSPSLAAGTSLKSLPLTVDTGEASFPMEQPSALLGGDIDDDEETEDDYEDEDVSVGHEKVSLALGVGAQLQEPLKDPAHKSITGGFLNMTLLFGIAISALLFVLVILSVAAFTWTRMRALSASPHAHHQHHHHHSHSNEGASSLDYCSSSPMITPTKNLRNPPGLRNYDGSESSRNEGGCCYDCDGDGGSSGTNSNNGCYSYSSSEPQPLLYCQEDYSWEECHHQQTPPSPYYSVGLTTTTNHLWSYLRNYNSKDDANNILHCSFQTSPQNSRGSQSTGVAVISSNSNDLTMPLVTPGGYPSSSYLNYYKGGSNNIAYSLLGDCSSSLK